MNLRRIYVMKKKATLLAGLLTLSMTASLAGCGNSSKETQTTSAAGATEETNVENAVPNDEASDDAAQPVKITF